MLDAWIIEEILRRDRQEREERRPSLELPLYPPEFDDPECGGRCNEEQGERGVVVIDFCL